MNHSLVVKYLSNMYKAPGSIPRTKGEKQKPKPNLLSSFQFG